MWNTFKEIKLSAPSSTSGMPRFTSQEKAVPRKLHEITSETSSRISTHFVEMDGVYGGGIVKGSVSLIAGDPGIGKSTLLLQVGLHIAAHTQGDAPVLYVSGEESEQQVKLRAERIVGNMRSTQNMSNNFLLVAMTNTDEIAELITTLRPAFVIIDSIQTVSSENAGGLSGAVAQVRYATAAFVQVAKTHGIPVVIVGHVTKEGMVAGPMTLSHMVDTVLFLEGEKETSMRILRSLKNRFGPVDEVGIFMMAGEGMTEVGNPEHIFLSKQTAGAPGSALVATLEGTRSFLVEVQALAVYTKLPFPRRVASGTDAKRLELLLAVLQKHGKLPVESMDVFVNVAGGLKLTDRAADIAICLAIYSSIKNISLHDTIAMAEVGLLGELRSVSGIEKREKAAKKLGYKKIISAKTHKSLWDVIQSIGTGKDKNG